MYMYIPFPSYLHVRAPEELVLAETRLSVNGEFFIFYMYISIHVMVSLVPVSRYGFEHMCSVHYSAHCVRERDERT